MFAEPTGMDESSSSPFSAILNNNGSIENSINSSLSAVNNQIQTTATVGGGGRGGRAAREGDWICADCSNVNFAKRTRCNKCGLLKSKLKPQSSSSLDTLNDHLMSTSGIVGSAATTATTGATDHLTADGLLSSSNSMFKKGDWTCSACGNVNWARRDKCNLCFAMKPTLLPDADVKRLGKAGGHYDIQDPKDRLEHDSDDEEFDEFGRRKRKKSRKEFNGGSGIGGIGGSGGSGGIGSDNIDGSYESINEGGVDYSQVAVNLQQQSSNSSSMNRTKLLPPTRHEEKMAIIRAAEAEHIQLVFPPAPLTESESEKDDCSSSTQQSDRNSHHHSHSHSHYHHNTNSSSSNRRRPRSPPSTNNKQRRYQDNKNNNWRGQTTT